MRILHQAWMGAGEVSFVHFCDTGERMKIKNQSKKYSTQQKQPNDEYEF
jgi:hypothetical protein